MGLPANLAAMPVISFVIMPFAMIGTLALPFGLEEWPFVIMGKGVDAMLWIARYFADLSPEGKSGALAPTVFVILVGAFLMLTLCQTRLRISALFLLPVAGIFAISVQKPELLISEDAKLVAITNRDGNLSVNRSRPNGFTTQVWQNATASAILVKPETAVAEFPFKSLLVAAQSGTDRFVCLPDACVVTTVSGAAIVWLDPASTRRASASDALDRFAPGGEVPAKMVGSGGNVTQEKSATTKTEGAKPSLVSGQFAQVFFEACDHADLVIAAAAIPFRFCGTGKAALIRADVLARKGAAEIRFNRIETPAGKAFADLSNPDLARKRFVVDVKYAVGEPLRPWSRERVFSRAARNMPDYQRAARRVAVPPSSNGPADSRPAGTPTLPLQTPKTQ